MPVKYVGNTSTLPISTVLYMSEADLLERIKIMERQLSFDYAYICHKGENGAKDHIHLLLRTKAKQFSNISKIRNDYLYEIADCDTDLYKVGDSVPCKPFVESKSIRDWYLYSMHNKEYLAKKGESRVYEYTPSDIKGTVCLISDMQEHCSHFQETRSDLEIISESIQSGLSDFEILHLLPKVEAQCILNIIKGIDSMRKILQADESDIVKLINELVPLMAWKYQENNLNEIINEFEQKQKVRLKTNSVIRKIILNRLFNITKEDIYEACRETDASEINRLI